MKAKDQDGEEQPGQQRKDLDVARVYHRGNNVSTDTYVSWMPEFSPLSQRRALQRVWLPNLFLSARVLSMCSSLRLTILSQDSFHRPS